MNYFQAKGEIYSSDIFQIGTINYRRPVQFIIYSLLFKFVLLLLLFWRNGGIGRNSKRLLPFLILLELNWNGGGSQAERNCSVAVLPNWFQDDSTAAQVNSVHTKTSKMIEIAFILMQWKKSKPDVEISFHILIIKVSDFASAPPSASPSEFQSTFFFRRLSLA